MSPPRVEDTPLDHDGAVVVVGASLAGLRCVETLRQEGFGGRITLIGEEPHPPYDRPPLSKQVLAGTWPPEKATLADHDRLKELGLDLRLGHRAGRLDVDALRVELDDGSEVRGDAVVVATGAHPRTLPGEQRSERIRLLRTIEDSQAIRELVLEHGPGCRVVVVGAGFIGSEVASTCRQLDCEVDVVEMLDTPLQPILGTTIGTACARLHEQGGVRLHTGRGVSAILDPDDGPGPRQPEDGGPAAAVRVELDDGRSLPADLVVVGIGVVPTTDWLEGSGLDLSNGVRCDETLAAAPGVVAAGDVARWPHHGIGREVRIEHWQVAAEEGVAAGRRLLQGPACPPFTPVPYFWSDQYGVRIQVLGVPGPDHEVEVVDGSLEDGRFVAVYGREGRLTAALAISRPRQLMAFRTLLANEASWEEALATEVPGSAKAPSGST